MKRVLGRLVRLEAVRLEAVRLEAVSNTGKSKMAFVVLVNFIVFSCAGFAAFLG
ncbi:MAG TPA: hypothetical protein VF600_14320 [Abditibacteriaceae bacterium]